MKTIRVLQVFTVMNRGGAESMIMNYYRKIDKTKVQFDFLVHRKEEGAFDKEIESLGGKLYKLRPISPINPKSYYNELRDFFLKHKEYQIVHAHLNTFSCFPLKIAKEFKIPVRIAHAHIALEKIKIKDLFAGKDQLIEAAKKMIKFQLKKRIHSHTTHYFSCGIVAGKWLFGEHTDFRTMNNAIDTDSFSYDASISESYTEEFGLKDKLVIGHVGRFNTQKNHSFLLRIFADVLKKKSNAVLILIGDGGLRSKLESEASQLGILDKVKFLGVRSDIPSLLQMLDVFVFPSFYEGLPVTLIESQAAGLRVVASDTITQEVRLTEAIEFLSINAPSEVWAEKIIENSTYTKKDTKDQIVDGGYDIISNTEKIQNFYVQQQTN